MNFLIGAALFYVALTVFLYFYQRNLLYFPGGPRPALEAAVQPEIISVTPEDGIELEGLYWPAQDGLLTLVFFHGNGQAYQYWVDKLMNHQKLGYGVFFTDYRGYGGTKGQPSEQGIYTDARAFISALASQKSVSTEDMIFYGESLGTGVAVQMATEYSPKALILESAYSATVDVAKGRYGVFPVELLMKDKFISRDKIGELTMPKLFIHAGRDIIIPIKYGRKLYKAAPEPKLWVTIPEAGHNNLYDHGAALHIHEFLRKIQTQ